MRVLVTGATGFVGSHTAAALERAGHDVRILVRNPDRVPNALDPLGATPEVVVGDMTDPSAVAAAVAGCDAVVHLAAQIGVGGGSAVTDANVVGARTVLGTAAEAGVPRIAYSSSTTVHMPCAEPPISLDSPFAEPISDYSASKLEIEHLVADLQEAGHPITTVVLGGVYGPQSPDLVNSYTAILSAVESMMIMPPGGTSLIDVRDVAELLTAIVEHPDPGPRVLAGGHFVTWTDWVEALQRALGHDVMSQEISTDDLMALARDMEAAAAPGETPPLNTEAAIVMTTAVPSDDAASLARFGITLRPVDATFTDAIEYLRNIGRLPRPDAD